MNYSEAGKGSNQRPTDYEKYATNYDAIFRKKHNSAATIPDVKVVIQNSQKKGENK